jgi:hypothetical protein
MQQYNIQLQEQNQQMQPVHTVQSFQPLNQERNTTADAFQRQIQESAQKQIRQMNNKRCCVIL